MQDLPFEKNLLAPIHRSWSTSICELSITSSRADPVSHVGAQPQRSACEPSDSLASWPDFINKVMGQYLKKEGAVSFPERGVLITMWLLQALVQKATIPAWRREQLHLNWKSNFWMLQQQGHRTYRTINHLTQSVSKDDLKLPFGVKRRITTPQL